MSETTTQDRVLWRPDLYAALHVGPEAVRRMIRAGKLPAPDVDLSRKTQGWRLSTLQQAGIKLV